MIDFIVFLSLVAVIVILVLSVIKLRLKNRKLAAEFLQVTLDQNILMTKLAEEMKKK